MNKAILFDLDGTLSDSVPMILYTMRQAFADLEASPSEAEILLTIGRPILEVGDELWGAGGGQRLLDAYLRHYEQNRPLFPLGAFDGVREMLLALAEAGARLAVVTAKRRSMAASTVAEIGLADCFDLVISADDTQKHKPDPEPVLFALERLGVQPERACFVGDSIHDLQSGLAAGCPAVAVSWGAGRLEQLQALRPTFLATEMGQLRDYLLAWLQG